MISQPVANFFINEIASFYKWRGSNLIADIVLFEIRFFDAESPTGSAQARQTEEALEG
jgi:hypothetical protein